MIKQLEYVCELEATLKKNHSWHKLLRRRNDDYLPTTHENNVLANVNDLSPVLKEWHPLLNSLIFLLLQKNVASHKTPGIPEKECSVSCLSYSTCSEFASSFTHTLPPP